jgi:hypothetical protein
MTIEIKANEADGLKLMKMLTAMNRTIIGGELVESVECRRKGKIWTGTIQTQTGKNWFVDGKPIYQELE